MKRIRLSGTVKTVAGSLGLFIILYYAMIIFFSDTCSTRFNFSKYENVTYFLQTSDQEPYYDLPDSDYENLINISFKYTIHNSVCDNTAPLLLILIHTSPQNFAKRKVIRETWGKSVDNIKKLFLLGTPDDAETRDKLQSENFLYNDLLQGNFLDSYRNLTYKHVMGLKYVTYHCAQAKYILKVDDDTCVNIPMLKNFLIRDLSPYGAKNLLMCNVVYKARVYREFRSKWRVSFDEYPDTFYPTYCLGWYIIYSQDVVFQLYKEAQRTEYFWIDDVLVTGIVASKLNFIKHTDTSSLALSWTEINYSSKCRPFLFGRADMDENEIRSLWNHIVSSPVADSVTSVMIRN